MGHPDGQFYQDSKWGGRATSPKENQDRVTEQGNGKTGLAKTCFYYKMLLVVLTYHFLQMSDQSTSIYEILGPLQDFEGPPSTLLGYLPKPESCLSFSENLSRLLREDHLTSKYLQTRHSSL